MSAPVSVSRRKLLIGAGATALGLAVAPVLRATAAIPPKLPRVGLGTWITFNVGDDPALLKSSTDVVAAFSESGGGLIDSSPMYGSSQRTVGHALEKLGHPNNIMAADKVWTSSAGEGPDQIETSRRAWSIERFDLLQVHNLVSWQGHLETLFAMKDAGRLGAVGITTSHGRRHGDMERIMANQPLDFVQLTYNAVDREAEERLLPLARERGITVIVNRPFRRGALTGQLSSAPLPGYATEMGAESWAELLLKFILAHPAAPIAIPATTSVEHVRQNKRAESGAMPDEKLRARIAADVIAA